MIKGYLIGPKCFLGCPKMNGRVATKECNNVPIPCTCLSSRVRKRSSSAIKRMIPWLGMGATKCLFIVTAQLTVYTFVRNQTIGQAPANSCIQEQGLKNSAGPAISKCYCLQLGFEIKPSHSSTALALLL